MQLRIHRKGRCYFIKAKTNTFEFWSVQDVPCHTAKIIISYFFRFSPWKLCGLFLHWFWPHSTMGVSNSNHPVSIVILILFFSGFLSFAQYINGCLEQCGSACFFKHLISFCYSTPHLGCDWMGRLQKENAIMAQTRFPMCLARFSLGRYGRSWILDRTRSHGVWWLCKKELSHLQGQGASVDALDQHEKSKNRRLCYPDQPQPSTHHWWLWWKL